MANENVIILSKPQADYIRSRQQNSSVKVMPYIVNPEYDADGNMIQREDYAWGVDESILTDPNYDKEIIAYLTYINDTNNEDN